MNESIEISSAETQENYMIRTGPSFRYAFCRTLKFSVLQVSFSSGEISVLQVTIINCKCHSRALLFFTT